VLVHGDLSTKNILVRSNEITLIDWDDVQSLCWMADIARLTLWMKMNYDEHDADTYRDAFLKCYETKHDKNAFYEAEDILHVWYGLDNLNYFIDNPISEKIKTLLQNSRNKCGI
jgi:thiamine kinase-like enzyme